MGAGWLWALAPAPRDAPHIPELVIFALALALLVIPLVRWYGSGARRKDLVCMLGAAFVGLQVAACAWILGGLVVQTARCVLSGR
jgi:hypothetical protein